MSGWIDFAGLICLSAFAHFAVDSKIYWLFQVLQGKMIVFFSFIREKLIFLQMIQDPGSLVGMEN